MAKKATPSGGTGRKRATAKPSAKKAGRKATGVAKTRSRKPAKAAKPRRAASSPRSSHKSPSNMTAADALTKLIQSPLVADLLAIGATAALAAIAGKTGRSAGTRSAVKAAGKAAAAAMGQRISMEVGEIRKASKAKAAKK